MPAYFNENEPYVAQWLRNLWPNGTVDERDIRSVQPRDLANHRRVHLFAGIGGWEYALQLVGWPEDREVWTGSPPCQPFSVAGRNDGVLDPRHLWPAFHRLIAERHPPVIFGEQVASPLGRQWLAGVRHDLEKLGYAVGAADLCAASLGAPHIRQRLYWVADSGSKRRQQERGSPSCDEATDGRAGWIRGEPDGDYIAPGSGAARKQAAGGMGLADCPGRQPGKQAAEAAGYRDTALAADRGFWDVYELLLCRDGKARRVEPGVRPLAHGVPARVGRLRAYGNAIVPPLAAEFVRAYMDARGIRRA